jgi:hypothetical protein
MWDSIIYYDTGKIVSINADESEYLGFITSVVSITEMPAENGQTNVSHLQPSVGAPLVKCGNGIALCLDIGWLYFEPDAND